MSTRDDATIVRWEDADPLEGADDLAHDLADNLASTTIQATDWTVGTILGQIDGARIVLNPSFQRRAAWRDDRRSRFIESILLNFPIPQLVLAEMRDPTTSKIRYIVLDGKQRLLSLVHFAGNIDLIDVDAPLTLRGLELLTHLNGQTWNDIRSLSNEDYGTDFENRPIRTVVLRGWGNEDVLYHVFLRLNTGSVGLSPQELRNALHPGGFAEFVDQFSMSSGALHGLLGSDGPDFRMRDAELLVRYFAFRNFLPHYTGSLKHFLDNATKRLNTRWETSRLSIENQAKDLEKSIQCVREVFGIHAFRKYSGDAFGSRFNRAVFDVQVFGLWNPGVRERLLEQRSSVVDAFVDLSLTDHAFVAALESTTKSLEATGTRFSRWTSTLRQLGVNVPQVTLKDNKILVRDAQ